MLGCFYVGGIRGPHAASRQLVDHLLRQCQEAFTGIQGVLEPSERALRLIGYFCRLTVRKRAHLLAFIAGMLDAGYSCSECVESMVKAGASPNAWALRIEKLPAQHGDSLIQLCDGS